MRSPSSDSTAVRILIIGPMPPPYTGTTTLLEYLVDLLAKKEDVKIHVLNTLGVRGRGIAGVLNFGKLMWRAFTQARKHDIVTLHASTSGLHVIAPVAYVAARLAGKPLLIRKFAGDDYQTTLGPIGRRIAAFVLRRAELYMAESKHLVQSAKDDGVPRVEWYPNSRPVPEKAPDASTKPDTCLRYVYVGRIVEGKGMRALAEASKKLPDTVSVDVYGPWGDDLEKDLFEDCPRIRYHGPLKPETIIPTMEQYDASLLPTHYRGEGYPGAILESYLAGLPVIVTRWRALPEIVDESVGIFVEPRDADDLANAMIRLSEDKALFQSLRSNTRAKAEFFSSVRWADNFLDRCRGLIHPENAENDSAS